MNVDDLLVLNVLMRDLEDAEEQVQVMNRRMYHKNRQNPLEILSNDQFTRLFRLNKNVFLMILAELEDIVQPPILRISALNLQNQFLITLLFYATGSYQAITGLNFFNSVSQASVSRCIETITNALNDDRMIRRWIHFPSNRRELNECRRRFYNATGIPGGIGVIDCTHVAIVRPAVDEHIYVNRKQYHSINVQLICDETLKVLNVNPNFPGSTHDAYIWRQSNISGIMEEIYRHDPDNAFFLLGDSGYPLRPWLMTPLRNPQPGAEERFQNSFLTARCTIERCNGVIKNRFRCLLKHRVLHYKPRKAAKIVKACIVLHNICIQYRIPLMEDNEEDVNLDLGIYQLQGNAVDNDNIANDDLERGRQLRQQIINNHFD